ncbi:DUF6854 domain-containing protein [Reyranella soli]|uniref:DUF6854 domain-containing protein n=1 Tax=Reyranella soli TaxID=1230389 RepID=A0A512NCR1_9HYPH|nr:hypothetical protein [Reyranella soli]GEP56704.1 hypothetical protein RSO01_38700 [Reyranella soli]
MTVTVVTRWTTPDAAASTAIAKRSKALWMKNGALDVRLNQIFTGPDTGNWLFIVVFADMAAYAKSFSTVSGSPDLQALLAENAKVGAVMHERMLLVGADI